MMLKLEAYSPHEGIGIIRSEDTLRLVRPPYSLRNSTVLGEAAIGDAILNHGFSSFDKQFCNWEEAIGFLNQCVVDSRRDSEYPVPEAISYDEILAAAPAEVISTFLDKVEHELIPKRLFDHAENVLVAVLNSDSVIHNRRRAGELLKGLRMAERNSQLNFAKFSSEDARLASLKKNPALVEFASNASRCLSSYKSFLIAGR